MSFVFQWKEKGINIVYMKNHRKVSVLSLILRVMFCFGTYMLYMEFSYPVLEMPFIVMFILIS
jgi:hypothetical protein